MYDTFDNTYQVRAPLGDLVVGEVVDLCVTYKRQNVKSHHVGHHRYRLFIQDNVSR